MIWYIFYLFYIFYFRNQRYYMICNKCYIQLLTSRICLGHCKNFNHKWMYIIVWSKQKFVLESIWSRSIYMICKQIFNWNWIYYQLNLLPIEYLLLPIEFITNLDLILCAEDTLGDVTSLIIWSTSIWKLKLFIYLL